MALSVLEFGSGGCDDGAPRSRVKCQMTRRALLLVFVVDRLFLCSYLCVVCFLHKLVCVCVPCVRRVCFMPTFLAVCVFVCVGALMFLHGLLYNLPELLKRVRPTKADTSID